MLVEPDSLCWLAGRMVEARDGQTWAVEFARFSALSGRRPGRWQRPGQGAEAGACPTSRRRTAGSRGFAGHLSHVPRGWPCPADNLGRGQPRPGASRNSPKGVGPAGPCGRIADGPRHTDKPPVASGRAALGSGDGRREGLEADPIRLRVLHARRPFQRSAQAQAVVAAALPYLIGPAWAKTRRLLLRPRASRFWIKRNGVWPIWAWTLRSCRPCSIWKDCTTNLGDFGDHAWVDRDMGLGVGPHGPTDKGRTPLAGASSASS